MSCGQDSGSGVFDQQIFYFCSQLLFEQQVVGIKPCVNLAKETPKIRCFLEICIFYPILGVTCPAKREHYLVGAGHVSNKSCCFGKCMLEMVAVSQLYSFGCPTSPLINACFSAESHSCKFDNLLRSSDVIGWRWLLREESKCQCTHNKCKKKASRLHGSRLKIGLCNKIKSELIGQLKDKTILLLIRLINEIILIDAMQFINEQVRNLQYCWNHHFGLTVESTSTLYILAIIW